MIDIQNLSKTYRSAGGDVEALRGVSLQVPKGAIFGVIGFSGAGKSSLIRCINRLEEPDSGTIRVGDKDITQLKGETLRQARSGIGMIFQHFNLFEAKTVYENIAFPLEIAGLGKAEIASGVDEMLKLVGLEDKRESYPSQLSGGQKQRVGIARALVNKPEVLLCDEATSALDPQTTYSILSLLKELNRQLGVTILLITHELDVIRAICSHMAVMEDGQVAEVGEASQLFTNPKSATGRNFIRIHQSMQHSFKLEAGEGI